MRSRAMAARAMRTRWPEVRSARHSIEAFGYVFFWGEGDGEAGLTGGFSGGFADCGDLGFRVR